MSGMKDGEISLDTPFAVELGFTSDKFASGSYLWKKDNYIAISFIVSLLEGRGNLSNLFRTIQSKGFGIKVPTPFARMKKICISKGFNKTEEWFEAANCPVEVWVKEPLRMIGDIQKEKGKFGAF